MIIIEGIGVDFSPVFTMFKGKGAKESSLKKLSRKEREANEISCEFTLKKEKTEFGVCTFFRACKVGFLYFFINMLLLYMIITLVRFRTSFTLAVPVWPKRARENSAR